jgi:hypothetical protein
MKTLSKVILWCIREWPFVLVVAAYLLFFFFFTAPKIFGQQRPPFPSRPPVVEGKREKPEAWPELFAVFESRKYVFMLEDGRFGLGLAVKTYLGPKPTKAEEDKGWAACKRLMEVEAQHWGKRFPKGVELFLPSFAMTGGLEPENAKHKARFMVEVGGWFLEKKK